MMAQVKVTGIVTTTKAKFPNKEDQIKKTSRDPYKELANGIIIQAAKDYRRALRIQRRHPCSEIAELRIEELEEFFLSEWFEVLTGVNGEMMMEKLREGYR